MDDAGTVYVSFDAVPGPKGAAGHIAVFARALARRAGGCDLVTLPGSVGPGAPGALWGPGLRHHQLAASGGNLIERVLDFRTRLGFWWGRRRPRVVHVRSIWEGHPLAERKERVCERLVYEVNGLPSIELKYHYPAVADDRDLLDKLRRQEDLVLSRADLVVTVSRTNAAHLASRGVDPGKVVVIPNGVDLSALPWRRPATADRLARGEALRLLYLGTLAAWQGVQVAIEALALYRREFPAELDVVGVGRKRRCRELADLAERRGVGAGVRFHEPVPRAELAGLLHAHDVALVPLVANDRNCVQGCCPLKLLDALAAGTPVVASDVPPVRELVADQREALLVRPGSAKALKDGLLAFVRDPSLAGRLSRAGRSRAEACSWAEAVARLQACYDRLG